MKIREIWRDGRRTVVQYQDSFFDSPGTPVMKNKWGNVTFEGVAQEVPVEEFVEWCMPSVQLIGFDERSCQELL